MVSLCLCTLKIPSSLLDVWETYSLSLRLKLKPSTGIFHRKALLNLLYAQCLGEWSVRKCLSVCYVPVELRNASLFGHQGQVIKEHTPVWIVCAYWF